MAAADARAGVPLDERIAVLVRQVGKADPQLRDRLLAAHLQQLPPDATAPGIQEADTWWEKAIELLPAMLAHRPTPEGARLVDYLYHHCPPEAAVHLHAQLADTCGSVPGPKELADYDPSSSGLPPRAWVRVWDWSPVLPAPVLTPWEPVLSLLRRAKPSGPADPRTAEPDRATAARLGEILRLRTVSRYGIDVRVGIGPTVTVAATASAQVADPGGVLAVEAADAAGWLALLPVQDLHGIGPRQAATLKRYGIDRVGLLAALPAATVQRLLGKTGRIAADRARGIDHRTVTPRRLPASVSVRHRFPRDVLDGAAARSALLGLVVQLGAELRRRGRPRAPSPSRSRSPAARRGRRPAAWPNPPDTRTTCASSPTSS
ncbi:hypothetical protein ABZ646_38570 [Streptomyces sp. NPDC007162]|uniref:DNA polymerase Y family protein n=1 Tax=Streptomyces sp. NPDC007162 TaxID=3156917 RepID=UPI0033ECCED9